MPDQGLTPPFDASQVPDYLDATRKQMLAQMLMQKATQTQTPSDWDSMRVVPRKSILSSLAPIVAGAAAGKVYPQALEAQAKYNTGLFNDPQQQAPSQNASQPQAAPPNLPPPLIRAPGYEPPAQASTQPQTGPQWHGGLVPPGGDPGVARRAWATLGPQAYMEKYYLPATQGTPEYQSMVRAVGRQTADRFMLAKAQKELMTDVRPGGTLADSSGKPIFTAPDHGIGTNYDANGQPQSYEIADYAKAAANIKGAEKGAETAQTIANTPASYSTPGGGTTPPRYPGDRGAPPLPPALRGQPPAMGLPGQPQSAPAPQQAPPPAAAPQAPSASAAPKPYFQKSQDNSVPEGSPWAHITKIPDPNQGGMGINPVVQGRIANAVAADKPLSATLEHESQIAGQKLAYNEEAMKHLSGAEVGPLSDWLTQHRSMLMELGVPENLIPKSGTVTPTLELNKALKNAALQSARLTFPKLTEKETFLQTNEMSPSAHMTAAAISSLIQQENIKAQYSIKMAQDYGKYVNIGGNPQNFTSWYTGKDGFPLTRFSSQQLTPSTPGKDGMTPLQRLQKHPETKDDFKKTFGWLPYPGE